MRAPGRPRDQVREESSARVGSEELSVIGVEGGIEQLLNPRHIDFRILDEGVITVNENGGNSEKKKKGNRFAVGERSGFGFSRAHL